MPAKQYEQTQINRRGSNRRRADDRTGDALISPVPPQLRLRVVLPGGSGALADGVGGPFVVVHGPGRAGPCWVAAPASERACNCVAEGRASPWAVLHHSATGTVDVYRTLGDGSICESVILCSSLPAGPEVLSAA